MSRMGTRSGAATNGDAERDPLAGKDNTLEVGVTRALLATDRDMLVVSNLTLRLDMATASHVVMYMVGSRMETLRRNCIV